MERFIWKQAASLLQKQRRGRMWRRMVGSLAAVVVFVTTYMLILPAIALEKDPYCGMEEHIHTEECFGAIRVHEHTEDCFDEDHNLICDFDDSSEYGTDGWVATYHKRICGYAGDDVKLASSSNWKKTASGSNWQIASSSNWKKLASDSNWGSTGGWTDGSLRLICELDEDDDHQHDESCYEWKDPVLYDQDEFFEWLIYNNSDHYDDLILDEDEFLELDEEDDDRPVHVHDESCYAIYDIVLECGMVEHVHTDECYELPAVEEPNDVVIEAWVEVEGEKTEETTEETKETKEEEQDVSALINRFRRARSSSARQGGMGVNAGITLMALDDDGTGVPATGGSTSSREGNIGNYFPESPKILINGVPYKEGETISLYDDFAVELKWNLTEANLLDTLEYTYIFPDPIKVGDVPSTVLTDHTGTRKGVYSITDNKLTVIYDSASSYSETAFTVNASWDQSHSENNATIGWNDRYTTNVTFDESKIKLTKVLAGIMDQDDGTLVGIYVVNVTALGGPLNSVEVTDTLSSSTGNIEYFEGFWQQYYAEASGHGYGYKVDTSQTVDTSNIYELFKEYNWADFSSVNQPGTEPGTATFPQFSLEKGETCHIAYAVKLKNRVELDANQQSELIDNQATAEGKIGGEDVTASAEQRIVYKAESGLVLKEQGEWEDKNVPWTVSVNPERHFSMGGAIIVDSIDTEGLVYQTDDKHPLEITAKSGKGSADETVSIKAAWREVDADTLKWLLETKAVGDKLFESENKGYLDKLSVAAGETLAPDNIEKYVFVDGSKEQFVWIVPHKQDAAGKEIPYSYELSYWTDASNVPAGTELKNSASAGWKQWTVGIGPNPWIQQVSLEKSNTGIRIDPSDEGKYLVDWEIKISVPAHRSQINDVYLIDALPNRLVNSVKAYDWLEGVPSTVVSYNKIMAPGPNGEKHLSQYNKDFLRPAFEITAESDPDGLLNFDDSYVVMGCPEHDGVTLFQLYNENEKDFAQFEINDGMDSQFSVTGFGVWLGNLPATHNNGYTIAIRYTTRTNPAVLEKLGDEKAIFTNVANLYKYADESKQPDLNSPIATAKADYWISPEKAKDSLAKRITGYNEETGIVTYAVDINPKFNLTAEKLIYELEDVLSLQGAAYMEDSFKLTAAVKKEDNKYIYDEGGSLEVWNSESGMRLEGLPGNLIALEINNSTDGKSKFSFSVDNRNDVFTIPDQKLAPMTLTYNVQLPQRDGDWSESTIKNVAALYGTDGKGGRSLIDAVEALFDFDSAMHKSQTTTPTADNEYKAGFTIEVDSAKVQEKEPEAFTGDTWKVTVTDIMSKKLQLVTDSLKVYGITGQTATELSLGNRQYVPYYDERDSESNILSVTIKGSGSPYEKYRIVYDASVIGMEGEFVEYSNEAEIEGTSIKSERIETYVYVEKHNAQYRDVNPQVKLIKSDPNDWTAHPQATFDLLAYNAETGKWEETGSGLKTVNGILELTSASGLKVDYIYAETGTAEDPDNTNKVAIGVKGRWHKLVETEASPGYLKGDTYFYLGTPDANDVKPGDVDENPKYVTLDDMWHDLSVYNYKISLRIRKVDAKDSSIVLKGAEFALYSDENCTTEVAKSKEVPGSVGSYEFTFGNAGPQVDTTYYLKETKAPAGYNISDKVYTVVFNNEGSATVKDGNTTLAPIINGDLKEYEITNESGARLPESGGFGIRWYMIAGFLLFALAGVGLLYKTKTNQRGRW